MERCCTIDIKVSGSIRKVSQDEISNAIKALAGENCGDNDKVLITAILSHVCGLCTEIQKI